MKVLYKNRFDKQRRDLIKVIAGAGISKGLWQSCGLVGSMMLARAAEAADGPDKSLTIYLAGGAVGELWTPTGGLTMGPMSQPYEDQGVKNDMNFLSGATLTAAGHGQMWHRFAGSYGGPSFDVVMGNTISANHPLPFLNVGVEVNGESPTRADNRGIPTILDPRTAFARLTSALGEGGGGGGGGGGSATTDPKRLYVDLHKDAINNLFTKLGQHEREKLQSHLSAIEEIEKTLASDQPIDTPDSTPVQACESVTMPSSSGSGFDATAKLHIDIVMLALSCNITASASITFGNDDNTFYVPVYDAPLHDSHHCGCDRGPYITTASYMSGLAATTISKAKQAGVLDSTIITQVSDMGDGKDHLNSNVPMFVAGGGSAVQKGKVTSMGGSNQMAMYETVARILGADQHPNYVPLSANPVSGIAS